MAVSVELWAQGRLVDGFEQWWDDVEAALQVSGLELPVLRNVDPYDEVQLPRTQLGDLIDECRQLSLTSPPNVSKILLKIAQLSDEALRHPDSALWFNGD